MFIIHIKEERSYSTYLQLNNGVNKERAFWKALKYSPLIKFVLKIPFHLLHCCSNRTFEDIMLYYTIHKCSSGAGNIAKDYVFQSDNKLTKAHYSSNYMLLDLNSYFIHICSIF